MASDSPTPVFSWQFIVMIAATLGIFMVQSGSLPLSPAKGSGQGDTTVDGAASPLLTDSRLWADPFDSVPARPDAGLPVASAAPEGERLILAAPQVDESGIKKIASGQVCLMPIVVRADANSAEAHEMRIRFRMAAASGLRADGYTPDDPNHLMWVNITLGGRVESVPVEWFLPEGLSRQRKPYFAAILVVWLRDSVLFTHPLEQLGIIRAQLTTQLARGNLIEASQPAFKVIGPYWSGTLVDILNEGLKPGRGMTFYSSSATMADGVLDLLTGNDKASEPKGRGRLDGGNDGPCLVNLTCTDEQLAEAMINELRQRGIKPGNPDSRIAIISDWDTEFGRVLPLTFAAKYQQEVESKGGGVGPLAKLSAKSYELLKYDDAHSWPPQILRAYYLSGVEGNLTADDVASGKPADESKTAPGSSSSVVSLQRAEGEHQIDYIARLGLVLSQRINERNVQTGEHGKLDAIGVLGADVYDKLLLIQALRPQFKDAIFFTDSLDARFMDPVKAIPYTRNLVISTSYGFDLFRNFQVGAPPFRSTEQTGAFLAVQTAAANADKDITFGDLTGQIKPLGFEIGRTYPVPLDIEGAPRPFDDQRDLKRQVDKFTWLLHPPQDKFFPSWARIRALYFTRVIAGAVCLLLLYIAVMSVDGGHIPLEVLKKRRLWVIAAASIGFLGAIGVFCYHYDGIEPATWLQGVSLWPSEFVRILAFLIGFIGMLYCYSRVRKSRDELAREFGIDVPSEMPPDTTKLWKKFLEAIFRVPLPKDEFVLTFAKAEESLKSASGTHGKVSATIPAIYKPHEGGEPEKFVVLEALWKDACKRSTVFGRTTRAVTMTILYFAAVILLSLAMGGGPLVPYRGGFSRGCDLFVVIVASVMLFYLMFWVVDETHLCLRFIKNLGRQELTIWPKKTYMAIPALTPKTWGHHLYDNAASSYIDVCFIGKLSREAVPLILLPFVVLTLMIISRWSFFANWHWEALIVAIFGINSAICVYCAVKLRLCAVEAKERAIHQIARAASEARAARHSDRADALDALKELMEDNMEGAFVPWHQQPFVSALLIPFGGTGGLGLVEYLLSKQ